MDKLAEDSMAALKAGMSYGKYMAMKSPPVVVQKPKLDTGERECPCCGIVFFSSRASQKYCGRDCYEKAKNRRKYQKTVDDVDVPLIKICPVCGKQFTAESYRNKYCGDFCRQLAKNENVQRYQKRKREVEANTETLGEQIGL